MTLGEYRDHTYWCYTNWPDQDWVTWEIRTGVSFISQVVDLSPLPLGEEMPDSSTNILHMHSVHVQVLCPQHLHLLLCVSINSTNQQAWCDALSVTRTVHNGGSHNDVV